MFLSFFIINANEKRSGFDVLNAYLKPATPYNPGINAIIFEQKNDAYIPNIKRLVHQVKTMFGEQQIEFYQTTYSADQSVAIDYYLIGKEQTLFLISYPVCNQYTGEIKMIASEDQVLFLCETLFEQNEVDESTFYLVGYHESTNIRDELISDRSTLMNMNTLRDYVTHKKRKNAGFSSGIIISTQTPEATDVFPRSGGTAWALHQATEYPRISMHRNGLAQPLEMLHLKKIKNGSIVYITGHCDSGAEALTGNYISVPQQSEGFLIPQAPIATDWSLETYRDLILNNSSLMPGDILTLVLWACFAGNDGEYSTAAQLGRLFIEEGIRTQIISSAVPMLRFDGAVSADMLQKNGVEFKSITDYKSIRIFKCSGKGIIEYENKSELSFFKNKMVGYALISGKKIVNMPLDCQVKNSKHYIKTCSTRELAEVYLEQNLQVPFILRPSSRERDAADEMIFTLSFYVPDIRECLHIRFIIDGGDLSCVKYGKSLEVSLRDRDLETALQEIMETTSLVEIGKHKEKQRGALVAMVGGRILSGDNPAPLAVIGLSADPSLEEKKSASLDIFSSKPLTALLEATQELSPKPPTKSAFQSVSRGNFRLFLSSQHRTNAAEDHGFGCQISEV